MSTYKTAAPRRWTAQEDELLSEQVRSYAGPVNWVAIAQQHQGRSNKDCRNRWMKIKCQWSRGAWTEDENSRLAAAVAAYGHSWTSVSEAVGTRSPDQCAKHWTNALDPEISHGGWTDQEDQYLMEAVHSHGRSWKKIAAQYFPNRSALELANRYNLNVRRLSQADPSGFSDTTSVFYTAALDDTAGTAAHASSSDFVAAGWHDPSLEYESLAPYPSGNEADFFTPYPTTWDGGSSSGYIRAAYYDYGS